MIQTASKEEVWTLIFLLRKDLTLPIYDNISNNYYSNIYRRKVLLN